MPEIKLTKRSVWGTKRYYPDCPISVLICEMMGKKCLSEEKFEILNSGIFDVKVRDQSNWHLEHDYK